MLYPASHPKALMLKLINTKILLAILAAVLAIGGYLYHEHEVNVRAADACHIVCLSSSGKMFGHRPILYGTVRDGTRGLSPGTRAMSTRGLTRDHFLGHSPVDIIGADHPIPCNFATVFVVSCKGEHPGC